MSRAGGVGTATRDRLVCRLNSLSMFSSARSNGSSRSTFPKGARAFSDQVLMRDRALHHLCVLCTKDKKSQKPIQHGNRKIEKRYPHGASFPVSKASTSHLLERAANEKRSPKRLLFSFAHILPDQCRWKATSITICTDTGCPWYMAGLNLYCLTASIAFSSNPMPR